jgi:hypothetical protein
LTNERFDSGSTIRHAQETTSDGEFQQSVDKRERKAEANMYFHDDDVQRNETFEGQTLCPSYAPVR